MKKNKFKYLLSHYDINSEGCDDYDRSCGAIMDTSYEGDYLRISEVVNVLKSISTMEELAELIESLEQK